MYIIVVILKVCHSDVESNLNQLQKKYWIAKERLKLF